MPSFKRRFVIGQKRSLTSWRKKKKEKRKRKQKQKQMFDMVRKLFWGNVQRHKVSKQSQNYYAAYAPKID